MRPRPFLAALSISLAAGATADTRIEFFDPPEVAVHVAALSGDGSTVALITWDSNSVASSWRWRVGQPIEPLAGPAGWREEVVSLSSNGQSAFGQVSPIPPSPFEGSAVRWDNQGNYEFLAVAGYHSISVFDSTADGATLFANALEFPTPSGPCYGPAECFRTIRILADGTAQRIGTGSEAGVLVRCSADGMSAVGSGANLHGGFKWTVAQGMQPYWMALQVISGSGRIAAGTNLPPVSDAPRVYWTDLTRFSEGLLFPAMGQETGSWVHAISYEGHRVCGLSQSGGGRAFLGTLLLGTGCSHDLTALAQVQGADLRGHTLITAQAISDDGNTIAGLAQVGTGAIRVYRLTIMGEISGDWNRDFNVSVQDLFDFLAGYFEGVSRADFNGRGGISVQDIFDFLATWFGGC